MLLTPVNAMVVIFPPAPNVMMLAPPLNGPEVEKVTGTAFTAPWLSAKTAIKAILNARDLIVVKASDFITSSIEFDRHDFKKDRQKSRTGQMSSRAGVELSGLGSA